MRRAAIVSPIRTPVGRSQGSLASMPAGELGAVILRTLIARTKLDPERVDDVIFARGYANGEAPCIARWSLFAADFPISVPGYQRRSTVRFWSASCDRCGDEVSFPDAGTPNRHPGRTPDRN